MAATGNSSIENKTTMWIKGFEIFQNIEKRQLLQHDTPKQLDFITKYTVNKLDTDCKSKKSKSKKKCALMEDERNISDNPG